jgi:hypothetical protein
MPPMMAVWIGTSVNVSMEPRALETNAKVPVQASAQRKGHLLGKSEVLGLVVLQNFSAVHIPLIVPLGFSYP